MCPVCRTKYETSVDEAPPGISWSDGHKCTPEKVPDHEQVDNALLRRGGQDSTAILYKLLYDPLFRRRYAPNDLIVVMADTGNEHPETYAHVQKMQALCTVSKVPFFFLTGDMGYTSDSWSQGLIKFYESKNAVGSKAFPKTCTDKLKITPIYNWLDEYVHKTYGTTKVGRKRAITEFAQTHGRIRVLLGIAAKEEKRMSTNDSAPQKWMRECVDKVYPLIDLGWDRQACQDYISKELGRSVPLPSNCILCPFMSYQELLYLYRVMPEWYNKWVELEQNKINANSHLDPKKNMGVWGNKLLPEALKVAQQKYGHMSIAELRDYKMSHGHCVNSKY